MAVRKQCNLIPKTLLSQKIRIVMLSQKEFKLILIAGVSYLNENRVSSTSAAWR